MSCVSISGHYVCAVKGIQPHPHITAHSLKRVSGLLAMRSLAESSASWLLTCFHCAKTAVLLALAGRRGL